MAVSQLIDNIKRIKACVVGDNLRDRFERFGKHVNYKLLLPQNFCGLILQRSGKLHFCGTSACHHFVGLKAPSHDHDGVVEGSLSLLYELFSTTS